MNRAFKFIVFLLCLCAGVPAAYGQHCTLQTMVGTYALHEIGASHFLNPTPQPTLHFVGATAPFANVGLVTFKPSGIGDGYYWITAGELDGGFDPIPVEITITEMNADCTGKFTYVANRRAACRRPSRNASCFSTTAGQQTAMGTYVIGIQNIIVDQPTIAIADTVLIREEVSMTGDYTGKMYEKYADHPPVETWVQGTVTVNPDCSFTSSLQIPQYFVNLLGKGVFFNGGKEFYMLVPGDPTLPLDQQWLKYSFVYGKRVGP